jgi:hypothetical protein
MILGTEPGLMEQPYNQNLFVTDPHMNQYTGCRHGPMSRFESREPMSQDFSHAKTSPTRPWQDCALGRTLEHAAPRLFTVDIYGFG